ncbi:MAG: tripartite tricarboxylate transporter substrate binding protein [Reyranellaceae bacterium]
MRPAPGAPSRRGVLGLAGLATAAAVASRAAAQTWPTRPIRLVVPFAAGAVADIVARTFGEELARSLGQPVVIDNKPGAGGVIGTAEAARAAPDGYTLLLATQGTMVHDIGLYARPGYDPLADFDQVAAIGALANVLVVPAGSPARKVADVLAAARTRPGELTYSSGGSGLTHHMAALLFERATGVRMLHVPYRATPAGLLAVVNGEVALGFYNTPLVLGLIASGKLRALAVTSAQRSGLLPEVPTLQEEGVKDYVFSTWTGFALPKGASPGLVTRLNAELFRIAALPAIKAGMLAQGIDMMAPAPASAVDRLIRDDLALWLPIIKEAGVSAD